MDPATIATILLVLQKIAVGAGVAGTVAILRQFPKAMVWFRRYLLGSNILIVGHARAGKTSFYNYLRYDQLADIFPTQRTDKVEATTAYTIELGDQKIDISTSFDIPGDLPISDQVHILRLKRPEAVLVFLSPLPREEMPVDSEWSPADLWLQIFSQQLKILIASEPVVTKKLCCLKIILNKSDLVEKEVMDATCERLRRIVHKELGEILEVKNGVSVIPCTLRGDKGGELEANKVTLELISCLKKRKNIFKK